MIYLDPTYWPAPSWLVSSVGRALHRYRKGHGFISRPRLNFSICITPVSYAGQNRDKKNSNQKQNKPNKTEKKIIEAHFEVFKEKKLQIKS